MSSTIAKAKGKNATTKHIVPGFPKLMHARTYKHIRIPEYKYRHIYIHTYTYTHARTKRNPRHNSQSKEREEIMRKLIRSLLLLVVTSYLASIASTIPLPCRKSTPRNLCHNLRTWLTSSKTGAGHRTTEDACPLDGVDTNVGRGKGPCTNERKEGCSSDVRM